MEKVDSFVVFVTYRTATPEFSNFLMATFDWFINLFPIWQVPLRSIKASFILLEHLIWWLIGVNQISEKLHRKFDVCPNMSHLCWKREKLYERLCDINYNIFCLHSCSHGIYTVWNGHDFIAVFLWYLMSIWHYRYWVYKCHRECFLGGWKWSNFFRIFRENVKNDMNERNRIEQLFYCHRCNDLAQVCKMYLDSV